MPELRFVLILFGALAIAGLLVHGLWTSKKEGAAKFSNRPLGKLDDEETATESKPKRAFAPKEDEFEIIKKDKKSKKEPGFVVDDSDIGDPLFDNHDSDDVDVEDVVIEKEPANDEPLPSIRVSSDAFKNVDELESDKLEPQGSLEPLEIVNSTLPEIETPLANATQEPEAIQNAEPVVEEEPELEVLVLNVHCSDEDNFVGTKLFNVMERNGLKFGEMDIYHRHVDLSGNGKVLFSVANMLAPGTLNCDDPATFTTKGISFFMTLPCYGDPEQNFKIMLTTAQIIADSMGGHVQDDKRSLMTPNRQDQYKKQIMDYKRAKQPQAS